MEYIQGLGSQTRLFLYSAGYGFLLGILYDLFRNIRLLISNRKSFVIFSDITYFVLCSFLVFCFALVMDSGQIRAFVFVGQALGWLIYYFSFGAVAVRFGRAVSRASGKIKRALRKFSGKVKRKKITRTKPEKNLKNREKIKKLSCNIRII